MQKCLPLLKFQFAMMVHMVKIVQTLVDIVDKVPPVTRRLENVLKVRVIKLI